MANATSALSTVVASPDFSRSPCVTVAARQPRCLFPTSVTSKHHPAVASPSLRATSCQPTPCSLPTDSRPRCTRLARNQSTSDRVWVAFSQSQDSEQTPAAMRIVRLLLLLHHTPPIATQATPIVQSILTLERARTRTRRHTQATMVTLVVTVVTSRTMAMVAMSQTMAVATLTTVLRITELHPHPHANCAAIPRWRTAPDLLRGKPVMRAQFTAADPPH